MRTAVIPHPTLFVPLGPRPKVAVPPLVVLSAHQRRALRSALRYVLGKPALERKAAVMECALILETPRDSLARRLIDLAPLRDRATLREQIL